MLEIWSVLDIFSVFLESEVFLFPLNIYLNDVFKNFQGTKRPRSPSPPPPAGGMYGSYNTGSGQKYPTNSYNAPVKQEPYMHSKF